jgi:hypothetical protein
LKEYRYIFDNQRPRKKFTCPSCRATKEFVRYVDRNTGEYLPEEYGKCERVNSCSYWLNPYKDGYAKTNYTRDKQNNRAFYDNPSYLSVDKSNVSTKAKIKPKTPTYFPFDILKATLQGYDVNRFTQYLSRHFGNELTCNQIEKYYIGSSSRWEGATTFPFIDVKGNIRAIQVKLFDDKLHTAKYLNKEGETAPCIAYHEYSLKYKYEKEGKNLPEWLVKYFENEKRVSCFFGEHLLAQPDNKEKYVAIVEAPKTAIVADIYFTHVLKQTNFI